MQIPRGYQKKRLFFRKSAILSIKWKFQFGEGRGGSLKKVLILVQRAQHKSTSDPVGAPKNNPFGAIFIEFAILRNATKIPFVENYKECANMCNP